jgi:Ca2+-binding RTX toxin-like protein
MALINGTSGNDTLNGTALADEIHGRGGQDTLNGGAGNDRLYGEDGWDVLLGGDGNDTLDGGIGSDSMFGGAGNDILFGRAGGDYLNGGAGNDWVEGGADIDSLRGAAGDDTVVGGDGDEFLGGDGNDLMVFRAIRDYRGAEDMTARAIGEGGYNTLGVDLSGARSDGLPVDHVLVFSSGGGRFALDAAAGASRHHVADASGIQSVSVSPDGPALRYDGHLGAAPDAVQVTGTFWADEFVGGPGRETAILNGGADTAVLGTGGDRVSLGEGMDAAVLDKAQAGVVDATLTDFDGAEDHLRIVGFAPGEVHVSVVAGDGTWLRAAGEADVHLLGVFNDDGFVWS